MKGVVARDLDETESGKEEARDVERDESASIAVEPRLGTVLIIDDGAGTAAAVEQRLDGRIDHAVCLTDIEEWTQPDRRCRPECILLCERDRREDTVAALASLRDVFDGTPVFVLTHGASVEAAVDFTRMGARDYLELSGSWDRLEAALDALADDARAGSPPARRRGKSRKHLLIGDSVAMQEIRQVLELVSISACNVILIQGETGTGKELAARTIHTHSDRRNAHFVDVNCAALSSSLLESELFGHQKGAFTGADQVKRGLFELADGGTIFLDEIGEMNIDLQAKLLRVLEDRSFRRVGGMEKTKIDVRVVASTNRDLAHEVEQGNFRRDLFYRLNVFTIEMPPLRERKDDISILCERLLADAAARADRSFTGFSDDALAHLARHDWPGNVRELRNVVERAVILEKSDLIHPQGLGLSGLTRASAPPPRDEPDIKDYSLRTAERELILRVLRETQWQKTKAAALLGITRATLYSKISQYGLDDK